jgi:hypothetical protein
VVRTSSLPGLSAAGLVLALSLTSALAEDPARSGELFDELARMDRELFEAAFVTCDQARFASLFTEDAEFYHDRSGAMYGENVSKLKSCPREDGVKRTLVAGSLEVYPIKDFGAVQLGRHTFTREGAPGVEIARFVHLWRYSEGRWRLARVLSFDHRPMAAIFPDPARASAEGYTQ